MAEHAGVGAGKEVPVLDQHVRGDGDLLAGTWREQRAIVADAQGGAAGALAHEVLFDQVEFGKRVVWGHGVVCALNDGVARLL